MNIHIKRFDIPTLSAITEMHIKRFDFFTYINHKPEHISNEVGDQKS